MTNPSPGRGRLILDAMTRLSESLAGVTRAESVVSHLVVTLNELFTPETLSIALAEPGQPDLQLAETVGEEINIDPETWALVGDEGVLATDPSVTANILPHWISEAPHSWMGAPIRADRHKLGAVFIGRGAPHTFGPTDLAVLRPVLAQAALALINAHLLTLLESGKQEWEKTVDAVPDAFCIIERKGRVRRANKAFADLVHVPVAELVGRGWNELMPAEMHGAVSNALSQPMSQTPQEVKFGDRLFTAVAHRVGRQSNHHVLVLEDQTDKRTLQDQVAQSAKMSAIGQLIAGIAHDLNNPLASVAGFAEYLVQMADDVPPRLAGPLKAIHQDAERASNIVKNLLTFARSHQGGRHALGIGKVLDATLMLLNNQLQAYNVETTLNIADDLPNVEGNATQLQQVFVNVITNAAQAIRAAETGGKILITAERWLDGVAITVEDDGPGIPEEYRDRVFEAFFTTKPEGEGTGLGLSICHGIVTEHGGNITLLDRPEHNQTGCAFRIELPGCDVAHPVESPSRQDPEGLRVLVVDDEPHILHYLRAALEDWGHHVTVASDGDEALERLDRMRFDIIITDLRMPRVGGRAFYDLLKREKPDVARQVVFCTGDTVDSDTLRFLETVDRPHIKKPFTLAELRSLLAEATSPVN